MAANSSRVPIVILQLDEPGFCQTLGLCTERMKTDGPLATETMLPVNASSYV